jgi:hypothetical protein
MELMNQMHVEEGNMTCRGCGHVYKIANGIPNMVSLSTSSQSFADNIAAGRARGLETVGSNGIQSLSGYSSYVVICKIMQCDYTNDITLTGHYASAHIDSDSVHTQAVVVLDHIPQEDQAEALRIRLVVVVGSCCLVRAEVGIAKEEKAVSSQRKVAYLQAGVADHYS